MRVDYIDDMFIIYLKNRYIKDLDKLEEEIICKLEQYYHIKLKGFYEVNSYIDNKYGTILEISKEDVELYIDYRKFNFNIINENSNFLYELDDILDINKDIDKFYIYNNKYYINIDYVNTSIVEFGKIFYKNSEIILDNAKLILM